MATGITKARKNVRSRRMSGQNNGPVARTPIVVSSASATGSVLTVAFNQVVCLEGVPQYGVDVNDVTPVSAAMSSPTTIAITFSGSITTATAITIPYEDPAVRNAAGGFVATSSVTIA